MFKAKKTVREKTQETIALGGGEIPYTLVRSNRAKRLSIKVGEKTGLEVVIPFRASISQVPRFLHDKEEWILRHLREVSRKKANRPQLRDGLQVSILGIPKTARLHPTRKKRPHVKEARALKFAQDTAYYDGHEILIYANTLTDAKKALEKHLREQARKHFSHRTAELAQQMGASYNRISIKGQKSRWGSCSREKNLNFNWKLVFARPEVLDSIIMHELAHTVHLNHGKRFYTLLEKHCPNHRELSRELKQTAFIL